jgi:zinc protease
MLLWSNISAQVNVIGAREPEATKEILPSSPVKPGGVNIPYRKFLLTNGLTVVVHEDHSDPIVYVDVTYHVGSAREVSGRSGFAHFFEHMMFQGSDNVADEEHFKIVTESGGTLNGTTNTDRTNYFETLPSNQLETALWLESDRMGYFLDAVTLEKFEIQRATVKNERGQNYDNKPYGLVREKINEVLYPFNHPYSWLTIGYIEDLNAATLQDLKNFFLRWYGPNNATLTVAGDVKTEEVVKLAEKYFGSIPRGPEVKKMNPEPAKLKENLYISLEDNIKFPMLKMVFPGVESHHKDEPALDALMDVLGGGKSSPLYQTFVKSQIALQANAYNPTAELAGAPEFTIVSYPDKKLADIEKMLRNEFEKFAKKGISEDELKRFKAKHKADVINSLQSVQGKGAQLASNQTFTGNPNFLAEQLTRYEELTTEAVMNAFKKYIYNKPAVIMSVVPKGKTELIAAQDNARRPKAPDGFKNDLSEYESLKYVKGKDQFDRSKRPAPGASPVVKVPDFWSFNAENGMKVIGTIYDELPKSEIKLYIKCGQLTEGEGKAGLAQLVASLMGESTQDFSAEAIRDELDKYGSEVRVYATQEDIVVSVSYLNEYMKPTLAILESILMRPKFDEEEFNRLKNEQLQGIQNQQTNAGSMARNAFKKAMYAPQHPFYIAESGSETTVKSITLEDVKAYYNKFVGPQNAKLILVGNLEQADAKQYLDFIFNWKRKEGKLPSVPLATGVDKTTIFFANKDNAAQSEIIIGFPALKQDVLGDYYKCGIMNYALGGAFNSRINLNLREKRGFTYGARANFNGTDYVNLYTASAGVKWEATDSAVVEFLKEIKEYSEKGATAEELAFTKSSIGQRDALAYETPDKKAGFMKTILENNYDKDLVTKQIKLMNSMTLEQVNALAKKYLKTDKQAIIIVGDKKKVFDKVQKLGFPIVEVDAYGNKL